MNALVLAVAVLSGVADTGPAARNEGWITIDRDVLIAFETSATADEVAAANAIEDPFKMRPDVVAAPITEERLQELVSFIHGRYHRCGGFVWHPSREEAYEEAARAARSEEQEQSAPPINYTIDNAPVVNALIGQLQEANVLATINALAAFYTRYHNCPSGQLSAMSIRDQWVGYAQGRSDVTVQLFNHTTYTTLQPSVILTITGTTLPNEVVVLGAHQDSTVSPNNCSTSRSPGADDDASGIASISEVIRAAMVLGYRPQRTVQFMAYAAEEVGLRGSAEIAQQYQTQGVNVVGVLQFDMTNYQGTRGADIVFYTDFTNAAQNTYLTDLANIYVPTAGAFPRLTSACGYGCSDHASWNNRGFPASFPFESVFSQHNNFIHSANDTVANSGGSARTSMPFVKLAAAYVGELAKGALVPLAPEGAGRGRLPGGRKDVGR